MENLKTRKVKVSERNFTTSTDEWMSIKVPGPGKYNPHVIFSFNNVRIEYKSGKLLPLGTTLKASKKNIKRNIKW